MLVLISMEDLVYHSGLINHLTVSSSVKTACQVLIDPMLAAFLSSDGSDIDAPLNFLTVTYILNHFK
jgi:hypothetical protein